MLCIMFKENVLNSFFDDVNQNHNQKKNMKTCLKNIITNNNNSTVSQMRKI